MVYSYSGMKASLKMYEYLAEGPMALYLQTVAQDAKPFKAAYEKLLPEEENQFPFTRISGRGESRGVILTLLYFTFFSNYFGNIISDNIKHFMHHLHTSSHLQ